MLSINSFMRPPKNCRRGLRPPATRDIPSLVATRTIPLRQTQLTVDFGIVDDLVFLFVLVVFILVEVVVLVLLVVELSFFSLDNLLDLFELFVRGLLLLVSLLLVSHCELPM